MVFAIAAPEVLGKVVGRDKGQNVSFEALQGLIVEDLDGPSLMVRFIRSAWPLVQG